MKGLVVGGGSIGLRHLRNLRFLGIEELALIEIDSARRQMVKAELPVEDFPSLDEGLGWTPDFALIAVPNHLHVAHALKVCRAGVPLFVEKPLSHDSQGLDELVESAQSQQLVSMVGCNMRFHPGPRKVKELLDRGVLGKALFARVQAGLYLPDWRPSTDYRRNYAARVETGGGCLLDCIHEIDLARWYLGEIDDVFCIAGRRSALEIETEDVAAMVCRHASGITSEIHLDYVSRVYRRGCEIAGEQGSILWDFADKRVRWFDAGVGRWTDYEQAADYELNQMYVEELQHFLACVREGRPSVLPIPEACRVMEVVFAAKTSARDGRSVPTKKACTA